MVSINMASTNKKQNKKIFGKFVQSAHPPLKFSARHIAGWLDGQTDYIDPYR